MIHTAHDLALVPKEQNPTKHRLVAAVREFAQRRLGNRKQNRKEPLEWDFVITGVVFWRDEGGIVRLMFATVAVTMWTGFFRFDCTEKLHIKDVQFFPTHVRLFVEKRKTDHYRYGQVVEVARAVEGQPVCPVDCLQTWVDRQVGRGLQPGDYLFQKIDGHRFRSDPLSDCLIDVDRTEIMFFWRKNLYFANLTGRYVHCSEMFISTGWICKILRVLFCKSL